MNKVNESKKELPKVEVVHKDWHNQSWSKKQLARRLGK